MGKLLAQNSVKYLIAEPSENKTMKLEETAFYTPVLPEVKGKSNFAISPSDAIVLFNGKNVDKWVGSENGGLPQ